jgi:hypothetical protein
MSFLIRVVLEISKNGQCLYYRNVLFQLMYKICLTGFAHYMTFKTLSKRQNGTVDPSLFSLHLIEGRVIPDWKKFISSGQRF